MSALRSLLEGDDGTQAFARAMQGSNGVSAEIEHLKKLVAQAQEFLPANDKTMRSFLMGLKRTTHHLEQQNTELRNTLQSAKRFFGSPGA